MRYYTWCVSLLLICAGAVHAQVMEGLINVTAYSAKGDAIWGATDCSMTAGQAKVTCSSSRMFSSLDNLKTVVIDDAKDDGSGNRIPLITTIAQNTETQNSFFVSTAADFAVPVQRITSFAVDSANMGSGYKSGTTQTMVCPGSCAFGKKNSGGIHPGTQASGTPGLLQAVSAGTGSPGTGGTPQGGTCVVTLTDGYTLGGQPTQFTVTLGASGGIASVTAAPVATGLVSQFTATAAATYNSTTGTFTESVSGCGTGAAGLSNATLSISYGVALEQILDNTPGAGIYATLPACADTGMSPNSVKTNPATGPGSGLQLFCDTTSSSTTSWGTENTQFFINALAAMNADGTSANPRCIYVPGGNYMIDALNQPMGAFSAHAPISSRLRLPQPCLA